MEKKMTTIEVTELAADYISTYRDGDGLSKQKAALCDIFSYFLFDSLFSDNKLSKEYVQVLKALCDFNDLINELATVY